VKIGVAIDTRFSLSDSDHRVIAAEARSYGYESMWTIAPAEGPDPFDLCALWSDASQLPTGISVLPLQRWPLERLIPRARETLERTRGKFTVGVGAGNIRERPVGVMREAFRTLRGSLGATQIVLGALGPQMLALSGELYDGVALNWCSSSQISWSRSRIAAAAIAAGRDPREVTVQQYVRVCIDEDVAVARMAFAKMVLSYALLRQGDQQIANRATQIPGADPTKGYRGHFARMGFDEVLRDVEAARARGASDDELAILVPDDLLAQVGYWGKPEGAARAVRRLAAGLDVAIVRIVPARNDDLACMRLAIRSCTPLVSEPVR
jgi:alkanesulfonate monooxygenase SsuD/methylene tetrahydromethanopterin reductase-like flavin-dependent oxidoreductase (luciferase family)